jgi:hypothetical protein
MSAGARIIAAARAKGIDERLSVSEGWDDLGRGHRVDVRCSRCKKGMQRIFPREEMDRAVSVDALLAPFIEEVLAAHAHEEKPTAQATFVPVRVEARAPEVNDAPVRLAVKTPHEQFSEAAVEVLEDLLARAKRGEMESLLVLFEGADFDGMQWRTAGSLGRSQTIGRIEILKARMLLDLFQEEETT